MKENKEYITEKDRSKLVRNFDYGEVVTNGWEEFDLPKIAQTEYSNGDKVYEDYSELDKYINEEFIPLYIKMKKNSNPYQKKGEMYPSIQLNHIVSLRLSHDEIQHVIYHLNDLGIRVGGTSPTLDYDIPNYDYITTHKSKTKEKFEKDYVEEIKLFKELRKTNDKTIRDKIIVNNMRLAEYLAYKYSMIYKVEYEELESYAYEGLIYSVDNFDHTTGYSFSTYAYPCIKGKMQECIALIFNNGKLTYRDYFYQVKPFIEIIEEAEGKTLRDDPNLIEAILDLMLSAGKISQKQKDTYKSLLLANLDLSIETDKVDVMSDGGMEKVFDKVYQEQFNEQIKLVLDTLTDTEKMVLIKRFGLDGDGIKTCEEVGRMFGVSRERIRQIEAKALRKLRHPARTKFFDGFKDGYGVNGTQDKQMLFNNMPNAADTFYSGYSEEKVIKR